MQHYFERNTMTTRITALFSIAAVAAVLTLGQETAPKPQDRQSGKMQMGGMMGMMKECREHCQKTTDAMSKLSQVIEDAKKSNDPAKMRAALEQVEKHHAGMNQHMSMCMRAMNDMEKMHGGMEGMKGMQHGSDSTKSDSKKNTPRK